MHKPEDEEKKDVKRFENSLMLKRIRLGVKKKREENEDLQD